MEIRFISSLTAEDENLFAPALLKAVGTLLDQLPIAYTLRIETTGAQVFQHTHAAPDESLKPEVKNGFAINGTRLHHYVAAPARGDGS
jgi:hypothetical protein